MAGIGTIGTTVIGTTVIGATGKLGQIRATALNEQVRAASFAKALLIRQKAAAGLGKSATASRRRQRLTVKSSPMIIKRWQRMSVIGGGPDSSGAARNRRDCEGFRSAPGDRQGVEGGSPLR
jgi:hypothetical protein